ncbi:MAG: hypothetical protein ACO1OB_06105, partial [Archangium sp.]
MRNLLGGLCCAFALVGCAPDGAKTLEGDERTLNVLPRRAIKEGAAATGTPSFLSSREAIAPRRLRESRVLELTAGQPLTVTLPVDFSTHGVFAQLTTKADGWLEIGGVQQQVGGASLVYFPLENRSFTVRSEKSQQVTFELVGSIDSAGGGFVTGQEAAPETRALATSVARFTDAAPEAGQLDDTFAKLARIELDAAAGTQVLIGSCSPSGLALAGIDTEITATGDAPISVTRWLQPGDTCMQSSGEARVTFGLQGRVRRFATTLLRPVTALTVLDTSSGTGGWRGTPLDGQSLDFELSSLTLPAGTTHAMLRV